MGSDGDQITPCPHKRLAFANDARPGNGAKALDGTAHIEHGALDGNEGTTSFDLVVEGNRCPSRHVVVTGHTRHDAMSSVNGASGSTQPSLHRF